MENKPCCDLPGAQVSKITAHFNAPRKGSWTFSSEQVNGNRVAVLDSEHVRYADGRKLGVFDDVPAGPHTLTIYGTDSVLSFLGPSEAVFRDLRVTELNAYQAAVGSNLVRKGGYQDGHTVEGMVVVRYASAFDYYGNANAQFPETFIGNVDGALDELEDLLLNTPDGWIIAIASVGSFEASSSSVSNRTLGGSILPSIGINGFPQFIKNYTSFAAVGVAGCADANKCPSFTGFNYQSRRAEPARYAVHVFGCNSCPETEFDSRTCPQSVSDETCAIECPAGMSGDPELAVCENQIWTNVPSCQEVDCPEFSRGENVRAGCTCDEGYLGSIGPLGGGYYGSCDAVSCPLFSDGDSVGAGCQCVEGFEGDIVATDSAPGFEGTCTQVTPPDNAKVQVAVDNSKAFFICDPGFCGTENFNLNGLAAEACGSIESVSGGYNGECIQISCPRHSTPVVPSRGLTTGCTCDEGYEGSITVNQESSQGYDGICEPTECPENSSGNGKARGRDRKASVVDGCTCNRGYAGAIKPALGGYSGGCVLATCADLPNAHGSDVISGCTCDAGFSGSIDAVVDELAPYTGTCEAVKCPENSWGNYVHT